MRRILCCSIESASTGGPSGSPSFWPSCSRWLPVHGRRLRGRRLQPVRAVHRRRSSSDNSPPDARGQDRCLSGQVGSRIPKTPWRSLGLATCQAVQQANERVPANGRPRTWSWLMTADPAQKDVYLRLANIYMSADVTATMKRRAVLNKATSVDPDNPDVYLKLGTGAEQSRQHGARPSLPGRSTSNWLPTTTWPWSRQVEELIARAPRLDHHDATGGRPPRRPSGPPTRPTRTGGDPNQDDVPRHGGEVKVIHVRQLRRRSSLRRRRARPLVLDLSEVHFIDPAWETGGPQQARAAPVVDDPSSGSRTLTGVPLGSRTLLIR